MEAELKGIEKRVDRKKEKAVHKEKRKVGWIKKCKG